MQSGENFSGLLIPLMGGVLKETEANFTSFNDALKRKAEGRQ